MAADITRRGMVGTTALGLASLGIGPAAAAEQPKELFGSVSDGKVTLPNLSAQSEVPGEAPNPDPVQKRLGVALVGLGRLSLGQILPGFGQSKSMRVTALVSGEADKARAIAAQHGVPEKNLYDYKTFDRLRDNPDVDAVYIVLPNALHAEYTERAAQAGKHVLCEKPMATSVGDAQRMIDACRNAKRKLMIAYRCQYEPYNRALTAIARSGEFGSIRAIEAVNGQNDAYHGQWRMDRALAGGGSLPDVGIYCLNAARYLTGEEPVAISAQLTRPKDDPRFREVEDVVSFTLAFPGGAMASCLSGYSLHESRRCRVLMESAWAELDPAFAYDNLAMRIGRREGRANAVEERKFSTGNQFALEMDHFADAIRTDKTPRTPGEEGLQDMKLLAAIYEAASGGGVVRLPVVEGKDTTRGPALPAEQG